MASPCRDKRTNATTAVSVSLPPHRSITVSPCSGISRPGLPPITAAGASLLQDFRRYRQCRIDFVFLVKRLLGSILLHDDERIVESRHQIGASLLDRYPDLEVGNDLH